MLIMVSMGSTQDLFERLHLKVLKVLLFGFLIFQMSGLLLGALMANFVLLISAEAWLNSSAPTMWTKLRLCLR